MDIIIWYHLPEHLSGNITQTFPRYLAKTVKYQDNRQGPRAELYSTQLSELLHILFDNGLFHSTSYFS